MMLSGLHMIENGRGHEVPALAARAFDARSARQQPRLLLPDLHVAQHAMELPFVHQRPQIGVRIEPVARAELLRAGYQPGDELVRHALFHDHAAGGRASLPG